MNNAVIYARYSSYKQNEMSIEGQIKACTEYATQHGFSILDTYIDRALTAKSDKRPQFQKMIADSAKKEFSTILVFQLDRFSRNRYDSAIYKKKLAENGVHVHSVKEDIAEGSSGILTESMIEAFAEYFSAQLSEKVTRGMYLNAESCKYNGGSLTIGFRIDESKHFQIDETMAPIVRTIFQKIADGEPIIRVIEWLNAKGIKTARGNEFTRTSLQHILKNKKYIGIYKFGDVEIKDGIPRVLSDELFYKVQDILKDERRSGHYKASEEYLLTGKLYCGYCKRKMTGVSGKSKNRNRYRYYSCHHVADKSPTCKKKNVPKNYIEDKVVNDCYSLLTDENIELIAERVVALSEDENAKHEIKRMEKLIATKEKNIETLMDNLENGIVADRISKRIKKRENEIAELEKQIALEKNKLVSLTVDEVAFFLINLRKGNINNFRYKKMFIKTLIHKIYLYDDEYTVLFNLGDDTTNIDEQNLPSFAGNCINSENVYQKSLNFNDSRIFSFIKILPWRDASRASV